MHRLTRVGEALLGAAAARSADDAEDSNYNCTAISRNFAENDARTLAERPKHARKLRKRQETADRPVLGPVSVHRRQPRNPKSGTFGVYGMLNGTGAFRGVLDPPFPASSVVSVDSVAVQ